MILKFLLHGGSRGWLRSTAVTSGLWAQHAPAALFIEGLFDTEIQKEVRRDHPKSLSEATRAARTASLNNRGRTLLLRKGRLCLSSEIFCRQRFPDTSHVRSWHRDGWVHLRYWTFRTWQLCECNCQDLAKLTRYSMWRCFDIFMKCVLEGKTRRAPSSSSGFGRPGEIPRRRDFVGTSVQGKVQYLVKWIGYNEPTWEHGAESQRA